MGTRFLASTEMGVHPEWKAMIVAAESREARHSDRVDQILPPYNRPHYPACARVLPTMFARQWAGRSDELAGQADELWPTIVATILAGRGQEYVPFAGQSVGLIHDIRPAADIISRTVADAELILRNLSTLAGCGC
jgi:nitronate monooxygenase/enoyl-[acyl-carrier protein] reductase II